MSRPAIALNSVEKSFAFKKSLFGTKQYFKAVSDLSFEIQPGESVAFLGANGAGKSTTIKILCGILSPTSGLAQIMGHKSGSKNACSNIGMVFGTRSQLHMHMTLRQCLMLIGEIYGLSDFEKIRRLKKLSDLFEIGHMLERRARSLSLGERMRCELVASLIHHPAVLLADEPTIGLDIIAKNQLRKLLLTWQKEHKTTILLTSHDLSDVEALCNRCILIDKGTKQFDGSMHQLKGDLAQIRRIHVTISWINNDILNTPSHFNFLKALPATNPFIHSFELDLRSHSLQEGINLIFNIYGDEIQDLKIGEIELEEVISGILSRGISK